MSQTLPILVTGGTGLTGQSVVGELLRRGFSVRVLCRPESAARAQALGATIALGDLRDLESLARAAEGAGGIVHAACTLTDSRIDIAAMKALLAGWRSGSFVFISSLDVYGLAGPGPITEETPLSETYNDYSRGKVVCERLLADAAKRSGRTDFTTLRAPYIWGPHPTARARLATQHLLENRQIILPGTEPAEWAQYQDAWIDARDLATIVAGCIVRPAGGPLNVLTGHFSWHDLYVQLIQLTGSRSAIVHRPLDVIADADLPKKHLYAQTWRFSTARLESHLGPIPRRSFEESLRDTVMCHSLDAGIAAALPHPA